MPPQPDPRPLLGEPLALDLLNTVSRSAAQTRDLLATPAGARSWLRANGLAANDLPRTTAALVEAREAIRDLLSAGDAAARRRVNAVLEHGRIRLSIAAGPATRETLEVDEPAWRPAVMAAAGVLRMLDADPDRIRRCEHPDCVLWFFDVSRNGTRRWCSMTTCGNRAKAARHYARTGTG